MAYTLKAGTSVQENIRDIAGSQIGKAIGEIDDSDLGVDDTVHQVRKRCKKLRGLIRLVRPCFSAYRKENDVFRDAAVRLSHIRDSKAILETYDDLIEFYCDQLDTEDFVPIRNHFARSKTEIAGGKGLDDELARFRDTMTEAGERIGNWNIDKDGFKAIEGGLGKTYKRARKAMAEAEERTSAEWLHEWRKRLKYHWYHSRLLSDIWPEMMKMHIGTAAKLSSVLGAHHDLALLQRAIASVEDEIADRRTAGAVIGLAENRQALLRTEAFDLGRKLLAEKPSALRHRWGVYWSTWQRDDEWWYLATAA